MSGDRWSRTAAQLAELEESRRASFTERVRRFVQPSGGERALDSGTGTGARIKSFFASADTGWHSRQLRRWLTRTSSFRAQWPSAS